MKVIVRAIFFQLLIKLAFLSTRMTFSTNLKFATLFIWTIFKPKCVDSLYFKKDYKLLGLIIFKISFLFKKVPYKYNLN